jgi:Mrp family chromosome partitioning ATPase
MLLAASSASSGNRTVLLDRDLRQQSIFEAFRNKCSQACLNYSAAAPN